MAESNFLTISLYQIQVFLTVCETKSFTAASQVLSTTQSAVSKSIAALENTVGFRLFTRNKNRLKLTKPGEVLYQEWKTVIRSVEMAIEKATLIQEHEQKTIIVGEPDSMKSDQDYWPAIQAFQNNHAEIKLIFEELPVSELVGELLNDELDVAIMIDYEVPTLEKLGISWDVIAESPFLTIFMHESNPLAERTEITVADLAQESFIVMSPTENANYIKLLKDLCRQHGFEPKISTSVPNARSMMSMLLRTRSGVVFANRFLYDADSPHVKKFTLKNTYSRLIAAWKDDPNRREVREFVNAITHSGKQGKK